MGEAWGLSSTSGQLQSRHGDTESSTGDTAGSVITACGAGGHSTYWGGHFVRYVNPCVVHRKLITLYVCNWKTKRLFKKRNRFTYEGFPGNTQPQTPLVSHHTAGRFPTAPCKDGRLLPSDLTGKQHTVQGHNYGSQGCHAQCPKTGNWGALRERDRRSPGPCTSLCALLSQLPSCSPRKVAA